MLILDWSRLTESLAFLVEIEFPSLCSIDEVFHVVARYPSLESFNFKSYDDIDNFRKRFGDKWELKYMDSFVGKDFFMTRKYDNTNP